MKSLKRTALDKEEIEEVKSECYDEEQSDQEEGSDSGEMEMMDGQLKPK
jgi:hypothetical protein